MRYLHGLVLLCIGLVFIVCESNNVCKTFFAYYTDRDSNPDCYHNPDMYLSVPEIVVRHGYPFENHTVITEDGYILTIFRIPHGRNGSRQNIGRPVFIQHGIGISSMVFVNIGKKSLAFLLADSGYDVWLGNFRGCDYSTKHITFGSNEKAFWNFSFHELGVYDLRAQLDVVASKVKEKLFYIGYSMGTTAYYVYNVEYPNIARERIKISINLAPIAFLSHIETPLRVFIPHWKLIEDFLKSTTNGAINQRTPKRIEERKLCLPDPVKINLCFSFASLLFGFDDSQQDMETLPIVFMQNNDAISIKATTHYVQLIESNQFRQFDYGKENDRAYGSPTPPEYNLSKINVPNYFIWAKSDPLATGKNTEATYSALPADVKPFDLFPVPYEKFNHIDFVTAKDIKQLLYEHIIKFLKVNEDKFV